MTRKKHPQQQNHSSSIGRIDEDDVHIQTRTRRYSKYYCWIFNVKKMQILGGNCSQICSGYVSYKVSSQYRGTCVSVVHCISHTIVTRSRKWMMKQRNLKSVYLQLWDMMLISILALKRLDLCSTIWHILRLECFNFLKHIKLEWIMT